MQFNRQAFRVLIIGFLVSTSSLADEISKVRDIRKDRKSEGLFIVFCARESPGLNGFPGHAYVIKAQDDPIKQVCSIAAFGFQPANPGDHGIVSSVPGAVVEPYVKDYDKPLPGVCRLVLQVDRAQFDAVERIRNHWSERQYRLTGANCIDFADDTAKALELTRPDRSVIQRPHAYIRKLMEKN